MSAACLCHTWTCRALGSVFLLLAAAPCFLQSTESPAAVVGKMYPRGNHWAVGHLMGKKSVKSPPEAPARSERTPQQVKGQTQLHNIWRDAHKFHREMSDLFFLALKLQDKSS